MKNGKENTGSIVHSAMLKSQLFHCYHLAHREDKGILTACPFHFLVTSCAASHSPKANHFRRPVYAQLRLRIRQQVPIN